MENVDISTSSPRMGDAQKSISTYQRVWRSGDERRRIDARVLSQLSGTRPFSDAALQEAGQGWRANVNFRDASSSLEQVLVGYWRLLHDVQNIAHVKVHSKTPHAADIEKIIAHNFSRFYDDWGVDYVTQYLRLAFNHVTFGVGPLVYPNSDTPRYRSIRRGDLIVPDGAPANVEDFEVVWIRQSTTLSKMWDKLKDEESREAAESAGWNIPLLRRVATRIHKGVSHSTDQQDWLEVERDLRKHSLASSEDAGPIREVHQYVREFDGKVSHYVFYPQFMAYGEDSGEAVETEFAFDDFGMRDRPESFTEVLACIFFEVGFDGDYHEVKGYGVKNYDIATAQNRTKSRMLDRTLIDGLNFRRTNEGGQPNLDIVNIGPFNILPGEFEQVTSYPSGSSIGDALAMLDQQTSYNNARYRDQSRQIEQTDTATQANILANLQSQVDIANATLYLSQVSRVFQEQFERLRRRSDDPDARKFRERCEADGLPGQILDAVEVDVRTAANPGAASASIRAQVAQNLMQHVGSPMMNPRYPLETYISSMLGANEVEKALVPEQSSTQDDGQLRDAMMENTHLGEGQELPAAPDDLHHIHIPVHLQPIEVMLQTYQETEQMDPQQLLSIQVMMPHLQAHLEYLKQDVFRRPEYEALWPRFQTVQSMAESLFARLEDARAQMDNNQEQNVEQNQAPVA